MLSLVEHKYQRNHLDSIQLPAILTAAGKGNDHSSAAEQPRHQKCERQDQGWNFWEKFLPSESATAGNSADILCIDNGIITHPVSELRTCQESRLSNSDHSPRVIWSGNKRRLLLLRNTNETNSICAVDLTPCATNSPWVADTHIAWDQVAFVASHLCSCNSICKGLSTNVLGPRGKQIIDAQLGLLTCWLWEQESSQPCFFLLKHLQCDELLYQRRNRMKSLHFQL